MVASNNPFNLKSQNWFGTTEPVDNLCQFIDLKYAVRAALVLMYSSFIKSGISTYADVCSLFSTGQKFAYNVCNDMSKFGCFCSPNSLFPFVDMEDHPVILFFFLKSLSINLSGFRLMAWEFEQGFELYVKRHNLFFEGIDDNLNM